MRATFTVISFWMEENAFDYSQLQHCYSIDYILEVVERLIKFMD